VPKIDFDQESQNVHLLSIVAKTAITLKQHKPNRRRFIDSQQARSWEIDFISSTTLILTGIQIHIQFIDSI